MATEYFLGHRGYSELYPENTMLAFKEAVEAGACGFELDVVKSADGVLFIMHDDTVDRTTDGTGKCSELTWDYIKTLDAGSYKDSAFAGVGVPSLEQVLVYFKRKICWILIEIKDGYNDIATEVAEMITARKMENQVKVQSFNWDYMDTVKSMNPDICTGLLGTFSPTAQARALKGGHKFLSISSYTKQAINSAHKYGFDTFIWTENTADGIQHYIDLNVDGIIGNDIELFTNAATANSINQCYPYTKAALPALYTRKYKRAMVKLIRNAAGEWI